MRTTRSVLDRVQRIAVERGARSRSDASLTSLQGGVSVGTLWLPEEDMERSPLSLAICLFIHLSRTTETSNHSRIKCERYIFIKKCIRSFIEVRMLCFRLYLYVGIQLSGSECNRVTGVRTW